MKRYQFWALMTTVLIVAQPPPSSVMGRMILLALFLSTIVIVLLNEWLEDNPKPSGVKFKVRVRVENEKGQEL